MMNLKKCWTASTTLREEVNNKISSVYKAKGSLAFASLTSALLVKANEGNVYNITDDFTTTAVFAESSDSTVDAEKTYYVSQNSGYSVVTPAGNENPATEGWYEMTTPAAYKFDVHAGDLSKRNSTHSRKH